MSGAGRKLTIRMPDNPRLRGSVIARLHVDPGMKVAEGSPVLSLSVRGRDHKVRAPRPGRVIPLVAPGDTATPGDPLYILNVDEEALAEAKKSGAKKTDRALVPVENAKFAAGVTPELIEPIIRSRRPQAEDQGPLDRFAGAWGKPILAIALYVLACFALLPILRAFGQEASWPVVAAMCAGSLLFAALINHLYAPVSGMLARWTVKLVAASWLLVSGLAIFGPAEVGRDLTLADAGARIASLFSTDDAPVPTAPGTDDEIAIAALPDDELLAEEPSEAELAKDGEPDLADTVERGRPGQSEIALEAAPPQLSSGVLSGSPLGVPVPVHVPPRSTLAEGLISGPTAHGVTVRPWGRIPPHYSASFAIATQEPSGLPEAQVALAAGPWGASLADLPESAGDVTGSTPDVALFAALVVTPSPRRMDADAPALPKFGLSPLMDRISTHVVRGEEMPGSVPQPDLDLPSKEVANFVSALGPSVAEVVVLNGEAPSAAWLSDRDFLLGVLPTQQATAPDLASLDVSPELAPRRRIPDSLLNRIALAAIPVPRGERLVLAATDAETSLSLPLRRSSTVATSGPASLTSFLGIAAQPTMPLGAAPALVGKSLPVLDGDARLTGVSEFDLALTLAGAPSRSSAPVLLGSVVDADPIAYRSARPGRDAWMLVQTQVLDTDSTTLRPLSPDLPVEVLRAATNLSAPEAVRHTLSPIEIETGPVLASLSVGAQQGEPERLSDTIPSPDVDYAGVPATGAAPTSPLRGELGGAVPRIPSPEPAFAEKLLLFLYYDDPRADSHPGVGDRWAPQLSPELAGALRSARVEAVREVVQVSSWCAAADDTAASDRTAWLNDRIRLLQVRIAVEPAKVAALEAELPIFGDAPPGFFHNLRPLLGGGAGSPVMQRAWDYLQAAGGERAIYFDKAEALARTLGDAGCTEAAWDGDGPANQIGRELVQKLVR